MKTFGKIKEFDGYNGIIQAIDGKEYLLIKDEIADENVLSEGDCVYFEPDIYKTPEMEEYIARFVRKLEKQEVNEKKSVM